MKKLIKLLPAIFLLGLGSCTVTTNGSTNSEESTQTIESTTSGDSQNSVNNDMIEQLKKDFQSSNFKGYLLLEDNNSNATYRFDAKADDTKLEVNCDFRDGPNDKHPFQAGYYSQFIGGKEYDSLFFSDLTSKYTRYKKHSSASQTRDDLKGYSKQSLAYIFAKWLGFRNSEGNLPFSENDFTIKNGELFLDKTITTVFPMWPEYRNELYDKVTNITISFSNGRLKRLNFDYEHGGHGNGVMLSTKGSLVIDQYDDLSVEVPWIFDGNAVYTSDRKTLIFADILSTKADIFSTIETFNIPDTVTTIGDYAFADCMRLTSITIPNTVTSIGDHAFSNCTSLESITIPSSVTSIGDDFAFGCRSLTAINIDGDNPNYTSIDGVVYNKEKTKLMFYAGGITNFVIPNSVTSIYKDAFAGSSLSSITIPNTVTSIGDYAFAACFRLSSINIPNSVTSIGDGVFDGCLGLESVLLPNTITYIGEFAFESCDSLSSITIPNTVTSIGDYAFDNCSRLSSITIPSSVSRIGYLSFDNCQNLTSITYLGTINEWYSIDASYIYETTPVEVINCIDGAINVRVEPDSGSSSSSDSSSSDSSIYDSSSYNSSSYYDDWDDPAPSPSSY